MWSCGQSLITLDFGKPKFIRTCPKKHFLREAFGSSSITFCLGIPISGRFGFGISIMWGFDLESRCHNALVLESQCRDISVSRSGCPAYSSSYNLAPAIS